MLRNHLSMPTFAKPGKRFEVLTDDGTWIPYKIDGNLSLADFKAFRVIEVLTAKEAKKHYGDYFELQELLNKHRPV